MKVTHSLGLVASQTYQIQRVGLSLTNQSFTYSKADSFYENFFLIPCYSAGSLPYVARDLMQFPCVNPSDGHIDLVIQSSVSGLFPKYPPSICLH